MRILSLLALVALCGCGAASYGASSDGVFPSRARGADYPSWEHQCVVVTKSNLTELLNDSGKQGWELVGMAHQNGNDLMCFKRVKAAGSRS
jgi:hypothetical protein